MPSSTYPWLAFTLVVTSLFVGGSASAQDFQVYVDDDGVVHISDRKDDERLAPYQIGDFERMALQQKGTPHAGLGFSNTRQLHAFLMNANAGNSSRAGRWAQTKVQSRYDDVIRLAAARYRVPFSLVKAVVAVESAFQKKATSHAGAQGLMQLPPRTAEELGVVDPFDPKQNIDGGTRYLAGLLRMFNDETLAIAAYNAGPGRVRRAGRVPRIKETEKYVKKVTSLRDFYEQTPLTGARVAAPSPISSPSPDEESQSDRL